MIKIDAEGAEEEIITSSEIIRRYRPTVVAAAYHRGEDGERLRKVFSEYNFQTQFTEGFLMFLYGFSTTLPVLRRGLIIATKEKGALI